MPNNIAEVGIEMLDRAQENINKGGKRISETELEMLREGRQLLFQWFNGMGINPSRWIGTLDTETSGSGGSFSVTVYATDDVGGFAGAERWRSRHGGSPSNQWVSELIFERGEPTLPQFANTWDSNHPGRPFTGGNWVESVNTNYKKGQPARQFFEESNSWDSMADRIAEKVLAEIGNAL